MPSRSTVTQLRLADDLAPQIFYSLVSNALPILKSETGTKVLYDRLHRQNSGENFERIGLSAINFVWLLMDIVLLTGIPDIVVLSSKNPVITPYYLRLKAPLRDGGTW